MYKYIHFDFKTWTIKYTIIRIINLICSIIDLCYNSFIFITRYLNIL